MDMIAVSGKIKSLEKKFLTAAETIKLAQVKTFGEFTGMLSGSHYQIPQNISGIEELSGFFENASALFYEELRKTLPPALYRYFLLKYDFHNLKVISLRKDGAKEEKIYSVHSAVDYFTMKEAFQSKNYKEIPAYLKPALSAISRIQDEGSILLHMKKAYFKTAAGLLKEFESGFIDDYLRIETDFANISTFIQQEMADTGKGGAEMFIEGGKIRKEKFSSGEILWGAVNSAYRGAVVTPVTAENYDIERYKALVNHIKTGRVVPSGIETIFAYFAGRHIEMDNVRRLAEGKFYNVSPDVLSQWALPPYQYV
ncbi:MAG: V-type ATPase subunit [Candidatus Omnitrophica bacterium]|nr:V-type ATPase subunit [Candidatus Omnitrophota bacterium]